MSQQRSLLEKGAIQKTETPREKFLSNPFLGGKKDGGNRPVINLKKLNTFIPYKHFKMEDLHCLKFLLEQNDFLCKISANCDRNTWDSSGQATCTSLRQSRYKDISITFKYFFSTLFYRQSYKSIIWSDFKFKAIAITEGRLTIKKAQKLHWNTRLLYRTHTNKIRERWCSSLYLKRIKL